MKSTNLFERRPRLSLALIIAFLLLVGLFLSNALAAKLFGLGKVVLYEVNPLYGYRPKANQVVARKADQLIKINNLGLRAEQDWDNHYQRKILFVGDSITYGGSYISNPQLFSQLVGRQFPSFTVGNAGVNGWGVNNVHGLIKETQFIPAEVFVSVFPEGDFYRGLIRIGGQPFWTVQPRFALEELSQFLIYRLHLKKMPANQGFYFTDTEKRAIVGNAARHLKDMDDYLRQQQRQHLIFITPTRTQMLQHLPPDPLIKAALAAQGLKVIYLQERLQHLGADEISACYHDDSHLSIQGHQLWAKLIAFELRPVLEATLSQSSYA